jgi:hypothetical protein
VHHFLRFRGGRLLHEVQSRIFRNPTVDLPTRFANSSPVVFPFVWITFLMLSRCSSFGSRFLILLLHCYVACCLLSSVPSFEVPRTALFLVRGLPTTFPLHHATFAWRVILILASFNSFSDSQCFLFQLFLATFLFHHATLAWWDTFLQGVVEFLVDP